MIEVKCQLPASVPFNELLPFQGALKARTDKDIQDLMTSLSNDGLIMPFAIWIKDGLKFLLDGHARHTAISTLAIKEPELLAMKVPVIEIIASSLEEAKHQLLQISSQYGKITPKGLAAFLADAPRIDAESLHIGVKLPRAKPVVTEKKVINSDAIIRLAVPKDKVPALLEILKTVEFIKIL